MQADFSESVQAFSTFSVGEALIQLLPTLILQTSGHSTLRRANLHSLKELPLEYLKDPALILEYLELHFSHLQEEDVFQVVTLTETFTSEVEKVTIAWETLDFLR